MKNPYQVIGMFYAELESYRLFIEMSERSWAEELKLYISSLEEDDEPTRYRFDYRTDLYSKLSDEFPQYQRQSYLIMLVSIFEDFMNQLCRSVEYHFEIKDSFSDFKGSGIDRAKQYLSKLGPMPIPANGKDWEVIKSAQSIRNIIAHAAGHLDEKTHIKQLKIISDNESLNAERHARIHLNIDHKYLISIVDAMVIFSKKLLKDYTPDQSTIEK